MNEKANRSDHDEMPLPPNSANNTRHTLEWGNTIELDSGEHQQTVIFLQFVEPRAHEGLRSCLVQFQGGSIDEVFINRIRVPERLLR